MRHEIVFAPEAVDDLKRLEAHYRAEVKEAIERHLCYEPMKTSRSRMKRLRGMSRPQYRLRVGDFRIFYDVSSTNVEVLAIVTKSQAEAWLREAGELK